jgi:hypothetical protein
MNGQWIEPTMRRRVGSTQGMPPYAPKTRALPLTDHNIVHIFESIFDDNQHPTQR